MASGYWDDMPDLNLPRTPQRRIRTRYDQFGGYSSEAETYEIPRRRARTTFFSWAGGAEQIRDELADELAKLAVVSGTKREWQMQVSICLQAKAAYEQDKTAGKAVEPEGDPWPFGISQNVRPADIDPIKHLPAIYTILAMFHDMMTQGFNGIITEDMTPLCYDLDWGTIHVRFLKQLLFHVRYDLGAKGVLAPVSDGSSSGTKALISTTTRSGSTQHPDNSIQPEATPESDPQLIYQADAAQFYNIPKSTLCTAASKKPGEPGYLWSGRKGKRVFYRKKDCERLSRSRTEIRKRGT